MANRPITNFFSTKEASSARKLAGKRSYGDIVGELMKKADILLNKATTSTNSSKINSTQAGTVDQTQGMTSTTPKKIKMSYKSYRPDQKEVICQLGQHMSYSKIEEKYGVNQSTVRKWCNNGVKEDGRKSNGKKPVVGDLEKELYSEVLKRRDLGQPVTYQVILKDMKRLYSAKYQISDQDYDKLQKWAKYCSDKKLKNDHILFLKTTEPCCTYNSENVEISLTNEEKSVWRDLVLKVENHILILDENWVGRFVARNNLSYRKITSVSTKPRSQLELDAKDFIKEVRELRAQHNIPPELIINFDETGVFYDQIPSHSYDRRGIDHTTIKASSFTKKRITAGLGVTAVGEKLPPVLIFKGQGDKFRNLYNSNCYILHKNDTAWMTASIFRVYVKTTVKTFLKEVRRDLDLEGRKGLFIIDNFKGHEFSEVDRTNIEKDLNIIIKYLRPYTTSLVQPLDLSINFLLKNKMKHEWLDWFMKNDEVTSKAKYPSKQNIYNWFSKGWRAITPDNIIKAFLKSGISNAIDGSEDILCGIFLEKPVSSDAQNNNKFDKEEEQFFADPYVEIPPETFTLELVQNVEITGELHANKY